MKFFIDTANLEEIEEMSAYGIVDGVTTNPSIIAREGKDLKETLIRIATWWTARSAGKCWHWMRKP